MSEDSFVREVAIKWYFNVRKQKIQVLYHRPNWMNRDENIQYYYHSNPLRV